MNKASLAPSRNPATLFAAPRIDVSLRADGSSLLRSPVALAPLSRCAGEWLVVHAKNHPDRVFLRERPNGDTKAPWRTLTYAQTMQQVEAIATWLLQHGLSADKPLAILSDNSIDHAVLMLAAMHVGVPAAPISQAYSLASQDHAKLKTIITSLQPGAIYVADASKFAPALHALNGIFDGAIIASGGIGGDIKATPFSQLLQSTDTAAVEKAFATVTLDTVAKLLFTSGSTGEPKGVINTQRMLCAGQASRAQTWPMVEQSPPQILDWLPWSHTFGGNHNFNLILRNAGTLTIDCGKPAPGLFQKTLDNLREVSGNIYFNVPRGFDMLVAELRKDQELAQRFFANLQIIFYAGAALPQNLWEALDELARSTIGEPVAMVSAWGSTETAPLATDCHFQAERSGVIGLPVPGVELKLVPNGGKQEIRVRGANVTPGYWKRPDLTAKAFDEEGYYLIGDAVRFLDPAKPEKGIVFDGRVAEDFKLMSGTWVNVGAVRVRGIECLAPLAQDIVVTGHDREDIGFLVFANIAACRERAGLAADAPPQQALTHPAVTKHLRDGLAKMKASGQGSSTYATVAVLMEEPASVDAGEITDKGYINQRAVLVRRNALVAALYAEQPENTIVRL